MPLYNSTLLSIALPEAANVHYYHTPSMHTTTGNNYTYVIVRLQVEQELFLMCLTFEQFVLHRGYISYMVSIQNTFYLPTTQHSQLVYKVDYDMTTFTDTYSLKSNYIWNYRMPLLLTDPLRYLNNHVQLHDFQHKAIATILSKSIQYYGSTLLTVTNLTQQHKIQLHRFLRDYQQMARPETDDDRLRSAPDYMTSYFTTNYFASLGNRLQMVQAYQAQHCGQEINYIRHLPHELHPVLALLCTGP